MIPLFDESRQSKKTPIITIGIIFLNALFFFLTFSNLEEAVKNFGMFPQDILNGDKIFTVFTSMFLHGDILHLVGNMWFLWIFGDNLEAKMGKIRFVFFYILCGLLAGFIYSFLTFSSEIPVIGASGAISGILGGYLLIYPRNKIKALVPIFFFLTTASVPAVVFLLIWFLFQFLAPGEGIAAGAHIAGFVVGFLLVNFFQKR